MYSHSLACGLGRSTSRTLLRKPHFVKSKRYRMKAKRNVSKQISIIEVKNRSIDRSIEPPPNFRRGDEHIGQLDRIKQSFATLQDVQDMSIHPSIHYIRRRRALLSWVIIALFFLSSSISPFPSLSLSRNCSSSTNYDLRTEEEIELDFYLDRRNRSRMSRCGEE